MIDLLIRKLPEGGYLVSDGFREMGHCTTPMMFAATTIDETLKFVKGKLEPARAR